MQKTERELTVYGMSGYNYKDTPTIMMKGEWLKNFGFGIGDKYHVECKPGKLIITMPEKDDYESGAKRNSK